MDYKSLPMFVLTIVLVGLLVGVGVLSLDKFGDAAAESTVITNESFVVPAAINGTVTLTNSNQTKFTQVLNSSGAVWASSNYSTVLSTGVLTVLDNSSGICDSGDTCYAYYTYDNYNTQPVTAIYSGRDAVGEVSITWMDLIITIGILAIIIGMVIGGFYFSRR